MGMRFKVFHLIVGTTMVATLCRAQVTSEPFSDCRDVANEKARLRCYEKAAAELPAPLATKNIGNWRLVRTPDPRGGKGIVSIMRTGEFSGSDANFVGLMFRCREGESEVQALIIMLRPLSLRAHPRIHINGHFFEGRVAPPGAAILLPEEVAKLAQDRWQFLTTLSVEIEESGTITKGLLAFDGFMSALQILAAACTQS